MARSSSLTLPFHPFGTPIRIDLSWALIALLVAWSLATGSLPLDYAGLPAHAYWLMATVIVGGLGLSILLHELAHALVGRAMGVQVERITLFALGGAAELKGEPESPGAELLMAMAGPAFSLVFAGVLVLASALSLGLGGPAAVADGLAYLAMLNLALAVFNLLPAFPMDGGRILRAVVWLVSRDPGRASLVAIRTSEVISLAMMLAGVLAIISGQVAGGLWWIIIGLFLRTAAHATRLDLEARSLFAGRPIRDFMTREVDAAAAGMSVADFVDRKLLVSHHGLYPVHSPAGWVGVVRPSDVLKAPRGAWSAVTVGEICTPSGAIEVAERDADAAQVMDAMLRQGVRRLPIVHRGAVVGIVTLQDLQTRLALERALRPQAA